MEPPILRAQFHLARQPDVGMSNDVPSPDPVLVEGGFDGGITVLRSAELFRP